MVVANSSRYVVGSAVGLLPGLLEGRRTVAISDHNVRTCHPELFTGMECFLVGDGEESKTLETVSDIYRFLERTGADRNTFIVGIGGGIVTDVAGFAASTYMRGLDFGFVSTTLLGQVDASVGGKNGVNFDRYKNLVGCFRQPQFVVADPTLLGSLPEREFRTGMAEVIKSAIIASPELFGILLSNDCDSLRSDNNLLERVIRMAVQVKTSVVERDAEEKGLRRVLNLGHTVAHAIEHVTSVYNHGEAVAVGLVLMAEASVRLGKMDEKVMQSIRTVVERYGLPVSVDIPSDVLVDAMCMDKKRDSDSMHLIMPLAVGEVEDERCPVSQLSNIIFNINR